MVPMPSSQCPMVPVGDGILEECGSLAALSSAFCAYPTNTMAFGKQQFCFHLIHCLGESVKLPNILLSKAKTPAILASPPKVAVPSPWPFQLLFSMPSPLCPPGEQGPELPTVPQSWVHLGFMWWQNDTKEEDCMVTSCSTEESSTLAGADFDPSSHPFLLVLQLWGQLSSKLRLPSKQCSEGKTKGNAATSG